MVRIFSALCTLLLIVAFTSSKARADPIVVTSGTLTVTGAGGGPEYVLFGNNFASGGRGDRGAVGLQNGFLNSTPGSVINVGARFGGSGLGDNHGGEFVFTGPPITVPFSLTTLTLTSPFEFSGRLLTCPQSCFFGPVVSNVDLVGSGTATFTLLFSGFGLNGKPLFTFSTITYNFEVPEPTSIFLLGGGLAALGASLRRKWRQNGKY